MSKVEARIQARKEYKKEYNKNYFKGNKERANRHNELAKNRNKLVNIVYSFWQKGRLTMDSETQKELAARMGAVYGRYATIIFEDEIQDESKVLIIR